MAGKINNLFEIISAPGLKDSKYGEHINAQFSNINENFAALANREFVQGPDGQGVNVVEIKFVGSNLTTQSPYITISKDLEASIKAAFETYNPDNQDWYKDITCSAYLDSDEKLHSIYPIIYSEVVEDIFNDDDVTESTTKSDFRSLQFDYDESGKLCLTKYDQNFPSIEYNREVGDFCWVLNGKVTEITARGPQGERGEDADSFDTLIVNQEPISKDSDLHEITHIYVDGALMELTPQIKTPADILWYNKFRQVWINNNIDKIFITAGPSKTESEAKTINYFGKMIKHKKSTQNTQSADAQSADTQSDNTPAQKATVLTSKRPPIIIGVDPGVAIDKADAAGAIDKIINVGEIDPAVKDYVDNHKDTIASQIVQASSTVYCMKLSPGTVFNMSMMAQTTTGTLYDELNGTYPGTVKGSTQALFLWGGDSKNQEAYTLHKSSDGLVIGHVDDYKKCQRGSASSADLKPDPLMTIQSDKTTLNDCLTVTKDKTTTLDGSLTVNGETQLNSDLTVTGATTLNSGLTVAEDQATNLKGTLTVTGETNLKDRLTVGKQGEEKSTTLNGNLTVTGETNFGEGVTITSNDFEGYFKCNEEYSIKDGIYTDSLVTIDKGCQIKIINIPYYIRYILNKDFNSIHHYIGKNFNFHIRKFGDNLYKINGNIEFNLELGQFIIDCFFKKNKDLITIPYRNVPYRDTNGNLKSISINDINFYGLDNIEVVGGANLNKWVGIFPYINGGIPTINIINDNQESIKFDTSTGIGIYKLDSLMPQYNQEYIHTGEMPTSISNENETWAGVHNGTLTEYLIDSYNPPYWATFLSSDPDLSSESNQL